MSDIDNIISSVVSFIKRVEEAILLDEFEVVSVNKHTTSILVDNIEINVWMVNAPHNTCIESIKFKGFSIEGEHHFVKFRAVRENIRIKSIINENTQEHS